MLTGGTFGPSFTVLALNPVTGAPVDKVKLQHMENRTTRKVVASGLTDSDGKYRFNSATKYYANNVWAQKGADTFSKPLSVYVYYPIDQKWAKAAQLYTDLALYRPGDSVRFSAVAYEYLRDSHRLLTDTELKAELYDANWQKIDSLQLRTDSWGRIEGDFTLPDEGLTGQFSLRLFTDDNIIGSTSFTVSDYKLPTYEAKIESIRRDWPAAGDVTVTARRHDLLRIPRSRSHGHCRGIGIAPLMVVAVRRLQRRVLQRPGHDRRQWRRHIYLPGRHAGRRPHIGRHILGPAHFLLSRRRECRGHGHIHPRPRRNDCPVIAVEIRHIGRPTGSARQGHRPRRQTRSTPR